MEILDRLKKLHSNNPDIQEVLETAFPELEDRNPYIVVNQLFMREGRETSLYQLVRTGRSEVQIKNVLDNARWTNVVNATNRYTNNPKDYYLTKSDFKKLLKKSGIKLESIKLLYSNNLSFLYRARWEE